MVKSNLALSFGVASCERTIVGQSAQCYFAVDDLGMGDILCVDVV